SDCEQSWMFVRCAHPNVSTFSGSVSATDAIFSATVSGTGAMFVRRRRDVFESLHLLHSGQDEEKLLPTCVHSHVAKSTSHMKSDDTLIVERLVAQFSIALK